jgi:hypothetical protein
VQWAFTSVEGLTMSLLPGLVTKAVTEMRDTLLPVAGADWNVPAAGLEWSCWKTGVHVADSLVYYAAQIIDQPAEGYVPFEISMLSEADPHGLLRTLFVGGVILDRTTAGAGPGDRGFHNYGTSDAAGFAAMGVVETLVHTYDIARALGLDWSPPAGLCAPALGRLFPGAPAGDPSAVLLWCTGRAALGDRPRRTDDWRWDGTVRA